eukprot:TRINITY_DN5402_c0_g1_i2.p1 TRINITY_DN5402_c0_g1~~TRINITY_DN5402_c0_g1_i2.p1  ORF type:complete len:161 (-),score=18.97 TRINITY_DN5402_c0_g1_i2:191-673(-)
MVRTDEDIVTYFNTCDKDHDGVVSVANLIETLEQLRFPQETIDYTVNMIQFDENGTIELEAFMECARKVAKGEVPNNEGARNQLEKGVSARSFMKVSFQRKAIDTNRINSHTTHLHNSQILRLKEGKGLDLSFIHPLFHITHTYTTFSRITSLTRTTIHI